MKPVSKHISENFWPERHTYIIKGDDFLGRQDMSSYCYPNYDDHIRLTIPGHGLTLTIEQAAMLRDLLNSTLRSFDR